MFDYLRITEILKPFTGIEFVDPELLQIAADRGTRVHDCIEDILAGRWSPEVIDEEVQGYLESFELFWKSSGHVFDYTEMQIEKRLFCPKLKITGKLDLIFTKPGRTYAIDWKTSSKKQDSWFLQGSAYTYLLKQNGYPEVDDVLFVHLKKGKKPTTYKDPEPEKSWQIFLKCLELYRYFKMDTTRRQNDKFTFTRN